MRHPFIRLAPLFLIVAIASPLVAGCHEKPPKPSVANVEFYFTPTNNLK